MSFVPANPYGDLPARFSPLREFAFERLSRGELPLWDPYIFGGVPNLGGLESAMLYPPNWLHLALPLGWALNASIALHLALAASLTALWARRLGASGGAAALAGLAWTFGGGVWLRLYAGHLTFLHALAWAPLAYLAVDGWREEEDLRWPLAGAAALALQLLAGHAQTAYYTGLGAVLYAALAWPPRRRGRYAAGIAGMLALSLGLCAAQALPAWEAAAESVRAGGYALADSFALPWSSLVSIALPVRLGGAEAVYFWETTPYCGAAVLLLAASSADKRRRALLGAAALLLLLALGRRTPAGTALGALLSGFGAFRGPGRLAGHALLLVCVSAGLGLDALRRRKPFAARALAALAAVELGLFAAAHLAAAPVRQPVPEAWRAALAAEPGDGRFLSDWTRHPNLGLVLGRPEVWGYDALMTRRWLELGAWTQERPWRGATHEQLIRATPRAALLRARWALVEDPAPRVVRLKHEPVPRVFLARPVAAPPDGALERMSEKGFDFRRDAAVEEPVAGPPAGRRPRGFATARDADTDTLELEAETDAPAVLVVSDAYARGWRAEALPGSAQAEYRVIPADHALRGVPLPPGKHRLRLVYEPRTWRLGLGITVASLTAWLAVFALASRRRRP